MIRAVVWFSLLLLALNFVGAAEIAPADLVGRWSFDEQSAWGTTAGAVKDTAPASPGKGAHGTAFGGAHSQGGGKKSSAAVFDGVDDFIKIPSDAALTPANGISIAGWFKINEIPGGGRVLTGSMVSKRDGYILSPDQDRSISFYVKTSEGWRVAPSPAATLQVGAWHHIVGTYDGTIIKVYVDGVERASQTASGTLSHNTEPICVGHDYCGTDQGETNRYFPGSMDELMIYRRALVPTEVWELRLASVSTTPGAACVAGDQAVLRLYGETNSHVALGNETNAPYSICFKSLFPNEPLPTLTNPYTCAPTTANPQNLLLRASGTVNAHAEDPTTTTTGYIPLCYGGLTCTLTKANEACPALESFVVALSQTTNAHVSAVPSPAYPYSLCCNVNGPRITIQWQNMEGQPIAGAGAPYDASKPYPFAIGGKAKIFVRTNNINLAGLQSLRVEVRDIDKDLDDTGDQNDDLVEGTLSPRPSSASVSGCTSADGTGCIGTVEFEWTFSDTNAGLKKMYGSNPEKDERAITDRFELVAKILPGSVASLSARESDILFAQAGTGWACNLDRTMATNLRTEQRIWTEKSRYPDSIDGNVDKQKLSGEACKGPDGKIAETGKDPQGVNRDNCCPAGMQCTALGCIPGGFSQCQDYKNEDECGRDLANVWKNKPSYVVLSTCTEAKYEQRCKWTPQSEASRRSPPTTVPAGQAGICEYGVRQLSSGAASGAWGSEIAACLYTYMPQDQCGEDNYQTVTIVVTPRGDFDEMSCNDPLSNCKGGVQRIPCGQPAVELPFFGMWQFLGSLVSIAILYVIMFHVHTLRRFLGRGR